MVSAAPPGSGSGETGGPRSRAGPGGGGGSPEEEEKEREPRCPRPELTKHSYWFDLWLFLLFDFVLFVIVYLLP